MIDKSEIVPMYQRDGQIMHRIAKHMRTKLENFTGRKLFLWVGIPCIVALCTIALSLLELSDNYWQGYSVEVAGVLAELAVVYLFLNTFISKLEKNKADAMKAPVHSKLLEYVGMLHVHLFKSLEHLLTAAIKKQGDPNYFPKLGFVYRYEELTKFQDSINRFLVHASLHLGTESYVKVMDYIDSTTALIQLVEDLQDITGHHPPPEGWAGGTIEANFTKAIRARHFEVAESLYLNLSQKYSCNSESFSHAYMLAQRESTPTAEVLLNLASEVGWIKLK